jgi:tetratricopeptide (TPR) repeat protein
VRSKFHRFGSGADLLTGIAERKLGAPWCGAGTFLLLAELQDKPRPMRACSLHHLKELAGSLIIIAPARQKLAQRRNPAAGHALPLSEQGEPMSEEMTNPQRTVSEEARALLQQNRPADAAVLLEEYLKTTAGTASDYMLLGAALTQSGQGMMALQALEQAVELEPDNPAAHFNLGQGYRQFGRRSDALTEFERALQLRPDYPAAARAAEELRQPATPPAGSAAAAGAAGAAPGAAAPAFPEDLSSEPVDERPLGTQLIDITRQLILSPGRAVDGGLNRFFNTPGAGGAILGLLLLTIAIEVLVWLLAPAGERSIDGRTVVVAKDPLDLVSTVLGPFITILTCAGAIAAFNRITGDSDSFAEQFSSLTLGFGLITATTRLVLIPTVLLAALLGLAGVSPVLLFFAFLGVILWALYLEVRLVYAATDINLILAVLLLGAATTAAHMVNSAVLGAIRPSG